MTKTDRRAAKSYKNRYGHYGAGSSHTREGSIAETQGHVRRIREGVKNGRKK